MEEDFSGKLSKEATRKGDKKVFEQIGMRLLEASVIPVAYAIGLSYDETFLEYTSCYLKLKIK